MKKRDKQQKIAVFGSSFNPPSFGHLSVIERLSHFNKILLVPCFSHSWGKKMVDFEKRCEWVEDFIKDINCSYLQLCTDEKILGKRKSVTTWALLNHLQLQFPKAELTFVLGPDNLFNFHRFYKSEHILKKWNILACPQSTSIRSTEIRERLFQNKDISYLTTPTLVNKLSKDDFYYLL